MAWYVNRQIQYPDDTLMVEIARGGPQYEPYEYANPGELVAKYEALGEGDIFEDPREAVEAALRVRDAWRQDAPGEEIGVGHGYTGGCTMPFSAETDEELRAWAQGAWEELPKCDRCGDPLKTYGRDKGPWTNEDMDGQQFCSEQCARHAQEDWYAENSSDCAGCGERFMDWELDVCPDCDEVFCHACKPDGEGSFCDGCREAAARLAEQIIRGLVAC